MNANALLMVLSAAVVIAAALRILDGPRRRSAPTSAELRAVARTTRNWRLAGLVAGVVVGVVAMQQDALGRGLLLAAPLCAVCVLVGVIVGELQVTSPQGTIRSAGLEVRRIRDYLPRWLTAAVAAATGLLALVLIFTTAVGSPDDLGRAGRFLAHRCSAVASTAVGPWPGSFYALPLVAVVLPGLVLAGLALRRIVDRPRSGDDPHVDDSLRRQAAEAVVAGCGLLVAVPLGGVSFFAMHALTRIDCAPDAWAVLGGALGLLVPFLLALAVWCLSVLAVPTGGRLDVTPRDPATR